MCPRPCCRCPKRSPWWRGMWSGRPAVVSGWSLAAASMQGDRVTPVRGSQFVPAAPQTYAYAPPVPVQTIAAPVDVAAAAPLERISESKQSEVAIIKAQQAPVSIAKVAPPLEAAVATASQSAKQETPKPAQPLLTEAMPAKLQQTQPAPASQAEPAPQPVISRPCARQDRCRRLRW
jgi:hypothetical protein